MKLKLGEKVYRLIAITVLACEECGRQIQVGQKFLLDKIPYPSYDGILEKDNFHNHKLCENCWKGSKSVIIDLTKKAHVYSSYERVYRKNY